MATYIIPIGMMTTRNIGVLYVMRMSVVNTGERQNAAIRMYRDIFVSKMSKSLEKRFIIRPSGVVSKNAIGACRILSRIFSRKTRDAQ